MRRVLKPERITSDAAWKCAQSCFFSLASDKDENLVECRARTYLGSPNVGGHCPVQVEESGSTVWRGGVQGRPPILARAQVGSLMMTHFMFDKVGLSHMSLGTSPM